MTNQSNPKKDNLNKSRSGQPRLKTEMKQKKQSVNPAKEEDGERKESQHKGQIVTTPTAKAQSQIPKAKKRNTFKG
jgi:hypothetical protein